MFAPYTSTYYDKLCAIDWFSLWWIQHQHIAYYPIMAIARINLYVQSFALLLSGLMDGLGVQVTLGQPDVTPERMVDRCLALASSELGCDLHRVAGGDRRARKQKAAKR